MATMFAECMIVAVIIALGVWVLLVRALQRTGVPFAGLIAAVVSWAFAALSVLLGMDALERAGW